MTNTKPYELADVSSGQAAVYSNHYRDFRGWVRRDNGGDKLWRPLIEVEPYLDTSGSEDVVSTGSPIHTSIAIDISNMKKNRMYAMEKMINKYPRITDRGTLTQCFLDGPVITYELGFRTRNDADPKLYMHLRYCRCYIRYISIATIHQ